MVSNIYRVCIYTPKFYILILEVRKQAQIEVLALDLSKHVRFSDSSTVHCKQAAVFSFFVF